MADPTPPPPVSQQSVDKIVDALLSVLTQSTSREALDTQQILLRRLALTGNVIPSRIPPPSNITEIGGYINLLRDMKSELNDADDTLTQTISAILGVAGPTVQLGSLVSAPTVSFVSRRNDRPGSIDIQKYIPSEFLVRSDFAPSLDDALLEIHNSGGLIALSGAPGYLPNASVTVDPGRYLLYLGREISIVSQTALTAPTKDGTFIFRSAGAAATAPFSIGVLAGNAPAAAVPPIPPANWDCLEPDGAGGFAIIRISAKPLFLIFNQVGGVLPDAGWFPAYFQVTFAPSLGINQNWNRFININKLYSGTTLGEELARLYSVEEIHTSAFASVLDKKWNISTQQFQ